MKLRDHLFIEGQDDGTDAGGGGPEGQQQQQQDDKTQQQQQPSLTLENLEEYLSQRDQHLMNTVQQSMVQVVQQMLAQHTPQGGQAPTQEEVKEEITEAQKALNISPEEFWRNPQEALEKFYKVKVAPLAKQAAPVKQQIDTTGLVALAETRVQTLWNALNEEQKKTYGPFLQKVIEQTDPRILADKRGIDSVWRLTKSHADDYIAQQEAARSSRLKGAGMFGGHGQPREQAPKVELSQDQAAIAQAMGLSPEDYKKYETVEEIEPGGLTRAGKK